MNGPGCREGSSDEEGWHVSVRRGDGVRADLSELGLCRHVDSPPTGGSLLHALARACCSFRGATYVIVGQVDYAFCRSLCPSGTYFALLSRSWVIDLHFENPDECIDCDACIRICPTDLDPLYRDQPIARLNANWDVYPDDYRHCASRCFLCGDCIKACD